MINLEDFNELVMARRSMRSFLSTPVPDIDIKRILETAQYAPSNCNTQPWKVCVVSGKKSTEIQQALLESIGVGEFQLDYPFDDSLYKGAHKERQVGAAKAYMQAADVAREDTEGRNGFMKRNLSFYNAPHAAFIFMPDWCGVREASDVGMYAQNLLLAMRAHNVGSCPQTILGFNADAVRKVLDIPDNMKLLFGVSFGYFDAEHPLNTVRTERANIKDSVSFYS